jgi:hypothetical protein
MKLRSAAVFKFFSLTIFKNYLAMGPTGQQATNEKN